nr:reverse transcriptase domain-containing protein [Tanacetum cinerariifolium]
MVKGRRNQCGIMQERQVNTARPKAVISAVRTNRVNDVNTLACWVWKSIKPNSASITLKRYDYVDVRRRSRQNLEINVNINVDSRVPYIDEDQVNSLLRSFDQKKNNTQVQQSLLSWPSQAQVQIMRGLSQVEARLVEFKENEVKYCERIRVLERDVEIRDNKIEYLKNELEQKDLSWLGLPEFVDDIVTDYSRPTPSIDATKYNKSELQSSNFSVFKHGESIGSIMSKPMIKFVKEADCPRVIRMNNAENARKSTVKYAEIHMNISKDKLIPLDQRQINVVRTNRVNDVKASACWVWKPIKPNSASINLKRYDYVDVRGRFRTLWPIKGVLRSSSRLASDQSSNPTSSTNPNPKGRNHRRSKQRIENSNLEEQSHLIVTMTDNRTMAELLRAPIEGYAEAIVKKNPRVLLPRGKILSEDLSMNSFPPSITTNLRNEISKFQQRFDESFHEAWDRYKDLLRACPHHGFTELHQLDTFYNALNPADQDSLNAAAGGNLLERSTQDVLTIIENKSKVRNSRSKPIASQVKACDVNSNSYKIAKRTHAVNQQTNDVTTAMTAILKQFQATPRLAPVKAVEETCVTCG